MKIKEVLNELKFSSNQGAWGVTPNNREIDYFGMRVTMFPHIFLRLAAKLDSDSAMSQETLAAMQKHDAEGGEFGNPMLYIDIPDGWREGDFSRIARVTSHEGRHRMIAQMKLSKQPVEVHIIPRGQRYEWRARHITPEMVEELNKYLKSEDGQVEYGPFFER